MAVNIFSSNYDDTYQTHPNLDERLKALLKKVIILTRKIKTKKLRKPPEALKEKKDWDGLMDMMVVIMEIVKMIMVNI